MPKVNQEKLSEQIQEIIVKQLLFALANLESPKQTATFLSDFLTDSETMMLSKRLAVAIFLIKGNSQTTITKMLSVSYSSTGAVSSWLKNADPSTLIMLNSIAQAEEWKEIIYNFKILSREAKKNKGRQPKSFNPEIDPQSESDPSQHPTDNKIPDFEALEGPELDLEAPTPEKFAGPSMEELLDGK
jgi:uncharacterized protein YerC